MPFVHTPTQLALLLLLRDQLLPSLASPPELFDPMFSQLDVALLAKLGLRVVHLDEQCARRVQTPTLFYLPHLEVCAGSCSCWLVVRLL